MNRALEILPLVFVAGGFASFLIPGNNLLISQIMIILGVVMGYKFYFQKKLRIKKVVHRIADSSLKSKPEEVIKMMLDRNLIEEALKRERFLLVGVICAGLLVIGLLVFFMFALNWEKSFKNTGFLTAFVASLCMSLIPLMAIFSLKKNNRLISGVKMTDYHLLLSSERIEIFKGLLTNASPADDNSENFERIPWHDVVSIEQYSGMNTKNSRFPAQIQFNLKNNTTVSLSREMLVGKEQDLVNKISSYSGLSINIRDSFR